MLLSVYQYISTALVQGIATALVFGFLGFVARNWLAAKIGGAIKYAYDHRIEEYRRSAAEFLAELKGQVDRQNALLSSAHALGLKAQEVNFERLLAAVDNIWQAVVVERTRAPDVHQLLDSLTPGELLDVARRKPHFLTRLREVVEADAVGAGLSYKTDMDKLDLARPYVGDAMYSLCHAYIVLLRRILITSNWFVLGEKDRPWSDDVANEQIIRHLLAPEDVARFRSAEFGKVHIVVSAAEQRIVSELRKIIAGEELGMEALRRGRELEALVAESERQR